MREGWELIEIGELCKTGAGGTPLKSKKEYYEGGDVPWLQSGEVAQGEITSSKKFITELGLKNSSAKIFPPDTVLVAMYGATAGAVGKLRISASTNQAVCGIFPNDRVTTDFLFYAFLSKQAELIATASGNAQPNISQIKIKKTVIPLPPLAEQKRIVAVLDEAFAGIKAAAEAARKNLASARELFETTLNATFTQKGEGWVEMPIGTFSEVFDGPHATPKTIDKGPVFLGITSLQDGALNLAKTRHVSPADFIKWTRRVEPRENDVVFSYETRLGQAAIIPSGLKCCLGRRMGLVRIHNPKVLPSFFLLQYLSRSFQVTLEENTIRGATVDRIPLKTFPSFKMRIPSIEMQNKIISQSELLKTQTQALEALYQRKLDALEEIKQSLLQKAFAGELTQAKEVAA